MTPVKVLALSMRAIAPLMLLTLVACGSPNNSAPEAPVEMTTIAPTVASTDAPTTVPTAETATEATLVPTIEPSTPEVAATEVAASEAITTSDTGTPSETITASEPVSEAAQLSFTPATYTDESAGFALDYPADWSVDPSSRIGVRGGQALLLSPGSTVEALADGGSIVSLVTYLWDPKNDIDAWVAQRKIAWDSSGFEIVREEQWQLADGRTVYGFEYTTPEETAYTALTTVGEDYLQIGGNGDQALIEEIAHTLRPIN